MSDNKIPPKSAFTFFFECALLAPNCQFCLECFYENVFLQVVELRSYLHEKGAEISEECSSKGLEDDMHKIIGVCDATFNNPEVPEQEVESTLNSIVSVLMVVRRKEIATSFVFNWLKILLLCVPNLQSFDSFFC